MHSTVCESVTIQNIIENEQSLQANSYDLLSPCTVHTASIVSTHNEQCHYVNLHLSSKGINMCHLNIQGICGEKLGKFSELQALLTSPENYNLHAFGLSETKLKAHKLTNVFSN